MSMSDFTTRILGDKRRWRQYRARVKNLPAGYREAAQAIERYLLHFGAGDSNATATMFEDLADLFEQAVADGTPVRSIVGDDPVGFVETFMANYSQGTWITKERTRLTHAIAQAEGEQGQAGTNDETGAGQ